MSGDSGVGVDLQATLLPELRNVRLRASGVELEGLLQCLSQRALSGLAETRGPTDVEVGAVLQLVDELVRFPDDNVAHILLPSRPRVGVPHFNTTGSRVFELVVVEVLLRLSETEDGSDRATGLALGGDVETVVHHGTQRANTGTSSDEDDGSGDVLRETELGSSDGAGDDLARSRFH